MAHVPIGPWKRDSTYRVHPLGLMDSTYRVPLLDSKLVRLRYAWYYRIKSPSGPSSALTALGTPQPSFWTLNAVEPRLTYPNLYLLHTTVHFPMTSSVRYQHIFNGLKFTLHRACVLDNVVITTTIETVEILDGRVGKRSVEQVRYVINNLLHLVIVKYGVILLLLCISTHLGL